MKKQILVTGGTGYIGSHTVVELQQRGFDVVVADNLSNSSIDVLDNIKKITGIRLLFEQIDLSERDSTRTLFLKYPCLEAVVHFAAAKAVGESVEKPLHYYRNNVGSLINLMECMTEFEVNHLVFSSSCTVYGQPDTLPVTEQTPRKDAESPYGNTKRVCEDIIDDTIKAHSQLTGISLRYFNPIGAHPSAHIGELPLGVPNNLVPFITQTAVGIRPELRVFGGDYNTPDGSAIRDYIDVVDLAQAHVVAIDRLLGNANKSRYEVFNLGTGSGRSVLELVHSFEKATGVKLNYRVVERRSGDIEQIWADTSYANSELGWCAKKSIEETLLSAWRWEQRLRNITD